MSKTDLTLRSVRLLPRATSALNSNPGSSGQLFYDQENNTLQLALGNSSSTTVATRVWVDDNYITDTEFATFETNLNNNLVNNYVTYAILDQVAATSFNGRLGDITLTSTDVVTSLGYIPLANNQTIKILGDATGTGSTAISIILRDSGVVAGTYTSVTVDEKGRVTAGTNPTTLSGYGITDAAPLSHVGTNGNSHAVATKTTNGFMSSVDKQKIDGLLALAIMTQ